MPDRDTRERIDEAADTGTADAPDKRYYRIGEVSRITGVKAYVLRYWESEFRWMAPQKSRSKQRLYRRRDIDMILLIKKLLYEQRFTIAGARKKLGAHRSARQLRELLRCSGARLRLRPGAHADAAGEDGRWAAPRHARGGREEWSLLRPGARQRAAPLVDAREPRRRAGRHAVGLGDGRPHDLHGQLEWQQRQPRPHPALLSHTPEPDLPRIPRLPQRGDRVQRTRASDSA